VEFTCENPFVEQLSGAIALTPRGNRTLRYWLFLALALGLAGFLVLPVVAFFAGKALAGPYEGAYGVLGFLINIYGDMSRGNWAAATLLATPALVVVTWFAALRLRRLFGQTASRPSA
jgi:hypothetical protein